MSGFAAPRWAVGFADLGLILLGCFAMLHAMEAARPKAAAAAVAPVPAGIPAAELFEPGEARLTEAGKARIVRLTERLGPGGAIVSSTGAEGASNRLDSFELAAARTAAVARALRDGGAAGDKVAIGPVRPQGGAQRIAIAPAD